LVFASDSLIDFSPQRHLVLKRLFVYLQTRGFPMEHQIRRLSIHSASATADIDTDLTIALFASVVKTGAEVGVVYRLDTDSGRFEAVARQTTLTSPATDFDVTLSGAASHWLEDLTEPVQGKPARDQLLQELPDVVQHGLECVLVAPLTGVEGLLGILILGRRSGSREFDAEAVGVARRSASLLSAALERDSLQQKLQERKLMERAKGILQSRRRLSEHQAYLFLRSESRRRRVPMVDLAREIIETQFGGPAARRSREHWKRVD
jgi:GAF domain-containing protein